MNQHPLLKINKSFLFNFNKPLKYNFNLRCDSDQTKRFTLIQILTSNRKLFCLSTVIDTVIFKKAHHLNST